MSYKDYAERHFSKARLRVRKTILPQKGCFSERNMQRAFNRFSEVLRKTNWFLTDADGEKVKIKPSTFKVFEYLFMGAHNRDTGRCNPKNATIEKYTGLSKSSVENATSDLEKVGIIRKIEHFVICKVTGKKRQRSNYYYLAKGVMKAMYLLLKCKEKISSLFGFFLAKTVSNQRKANKFYKSDDEKKQAAQQVLFSLQDSPISPRDGCDDYIDSLPMSPVRVKSDPAQELLARRYQGAL